EAGVAKKSLAISVGLEKYIRVFSTILKYLQYCPLPLEYYL
ncbi:unnamed protein product, partial [Callosobruchus maculatus]